MAREAGTSIEGGIGTTSTELGYKICPNGKKVKIGERCEAILQDEEPTKGGGVSMVTEPTFENPSPSPSPTPTPTPTSTPTSGGASTGGGATTGSNTFPLSLPTFLGGGGGGGGGASETDGGGVVPEKPNYVLYIGILLAVIIAYKVLSKKTPKT